MNEQEFHKIAAVYIEKLWEIANKQWFRTFTSFIIFESKKSEDIKWHKSIGWTNMAQDEVFKSLVIVNREIWNHFIKDFN